MVPAHSERVAGLTVQNAVAHNEGLGANWKTHRALFGPIVAPKTAALLNFARGRQPGLPRDRGVRTIHGVKYGTE